MKDFPQVLSEASLKTERAEEFSVTHQESRACMDQ